MQLNDLPKYKDIYLPLLQEISLRGGKIKLSDKDNNGKILYESLADYFNLSDEVLSYQTLNEKTGQIEPAWNNRVRWAKSDLVKQKKIESAQTSGRGIWKITELGRIYLNQNKQVIEKVSKNSKILTPQDFQALQEEFYDTGIKGEKFVLEQEKNFLIKHGRTDLANKICWIANENIAAGYDILSFSITGEEKYIEVKTSDSKILNFELTYNEFLVSKKHGLKYWIYKVINVNTSPEIIMKIQDPAQKAIENKIELNPSAYFVIVKDITLIDSN